MSLKERLAEDLKDAMRARDEVKRDTIRLLLAAIRKAELPKVVDRTVLPGESWAHIANEYDVTPEFLVGGAVLDPHAPILDEDDFEPVQIRVLVPSVPPDDMAVRRIIVEQIEQRRESIEAFGKAARRDLVDRESSEIRVLEGYLPARLRGNL